MPVLSEPLQQTRRDLMAMGIAVAAIIMFIGNGSQVVPQVVRSILGQGTTPDRVLVSALLLNIALILFGWRRLRDLSTEIAVRKQAEAQARKLAETDPLTGCLNRRSIIPAASAMIATETATGKAVVVAAIDLDNFKQINDCHSHQAGDAMLQAVSERIAATLPHGALVARMGGDEFACVMPFDACFPEQVDILIGQLADTVRSPVTWNGIDIEATLSIGLARTVAGAPAEPATLLHSADIAMFHAKRSGRNRIAWFVPSMESEIRARSELEAGIRRGIAAGEFVPFYEKQVDLGTGELIGFEMLARWNSPTLGLVGPELFIPVAEEIGVIADLSETLIAAALRDARDWDPQLSLSVNISPVQLRDPWFAQKLLKLLLEANFPPSRLEIEITESCLHENIGLTRSLIVSLKNQGIRVSLDDFGTGYSSLSLLRTLPIDRIKIDRSFITQLPDNAENRTIVQSILHLSEGLGLPVTVEGVESEDVLRALGEFKQLKAQGYLYGRPNPADRTLAELQALHRAPAPDQVAGPDLARRAVAG